MLQCALNCVLSGDTKCSLGEAASSLSGISLSEYQFWSLLATGVLLTLALGFGVGRRTADKDLTQIVEVNVNSSRFSTFAATDGARRKALLRSGEDGPKVVRSNSDWSGGSWNDMGATFSR